MKKILFKSLLIVTFAPLLSFAQEPLYVSTSGLLGWYPFTGNASDLSSMNNDGTVNGAILSVDRYPQADRAYSFGGSENITIGNLFSGFNSPISVSAWAVGSGTIFNCFSFGTVCKGFRVDIDNGVTKVYIGNGTQNLITQQGNTFVEDNFWHSFVLTYSGSVCKLYVDGVLDLSFGCSIVAPANTTDFLVGMGFLGNGFFGSIDDIGIWNRAITEQEVSSLNNGCNTNITYNINTCENYISPSGQLYWQSGTYYEYIQNNDGCDSLITINLTITATDFYGTTENIIHPSCQAPSDGSIHVEINSNPNSGEFFYFSEYYSENGSNKVIEIYNPTEFPYDLGGDLDGNLDPNQGLTLYFKLRNSSDQIYSFPPNTIIQPHGTIVIASPFTAINADLISPIIDGTSITLFYEIVELAYQEVWDVTESLNGQTRVRKNNVNSNNPIFDTNEWDTYDLSSNSLGSHNSSQYYLQWSDGSISNSLNNLSPGTYTYNVIGTENGCVIPYTIELVGSLSLNTQFNDTVCFGTIYSWNGQDYTNPGEYTQTLVSQYGCDSIVTLHLESIFNDSILFQSNMTFGVTPFVVSFENFTQNFDNYNFTWYFGDGTTLQSNDQFLAHVYYDLGFYDVKLEAVNLQTGCSSAVFFEDYLYVLSNPLGIDDKFTSKIICRPNPTSNNITIEVDDEYIGKEYELTDFLGRKLLAGEINNLTTNIDLRQFESGSYFIQIEGESKNHKLIKN